MMAMTHDDALDVKPVKGSKSVGGHIQMPVDDQTINDSKSEGTALKASAAQSSQKKKSSEHREELEALKRDAQRKADKLESQSASGLQDEQTIEGKEDMMEESKSVSFADEAGESRSQMSKNQKKKAR